MWIIRRPVLFILAFALLFSLAEPGRAAAPEGGGEVVGYYASWAAGQGYGPEDIPAERFTQINYAFAGIAEGRAVLSDPVRDERNLRGLTALREKNAGLRVVLSLGGWDESAGFSDAAASAKSRSVFVESCLDLILRHGLDGVDLDWEYPVSGGAPGVVHRPQDRENFTLLLRDLRAALDRQGRRDGKRYLLTIAGAVSGGYLANIEPQAVAEIVDHIFLMAYDLSGPWDACAGFNAPLYASSDGPSRSRASVDGGISAWLGRGVPAEKLVLGRRVYGAAPVRVHIPGRRKPEQRAVPVLPQRAVRPLEQDQRRLSPPGGLPAAPAPGGGGPLSLWKRRLPLL